MGKTFKQQKIQGPMLKIRILAGLDSQLKVLELILGAICTNIKLWDKSVISQNFEDLSCKITQTAIVALRQAFLRSGTVRADDSDITEIVEWGREHDEIGAFGYENGGVTSRVDAVEEAWS